MPFRMRILLPMAVITLVMAAIAPLWAVGAEGVDLTPLLPRRDAFLTAVMDEGVVIPLEVTNTNDEPRTVRVEATSAAEVEGAETPGVGAPIDWITVPGADPLELGPGEVVRLNAEVDLDGYVEYEADKVLIVLEVVGTGNVTARAATIVALADPTPVLTRGLLIVLLALWLLAMVAGAWWRWGRPAMRDRAADRADGAQPAPKSTAVRP